MIISAVIPAYNEATRIGRTVRQARRYVDEVVVVDDGSVDGTFEEAEWAGARVVSQENAGYIAAIKRGFVEARGDILVTLDADGEFPAERIPDLVQPILDGKADMVQGHRDRIPRPSERFLTWLANLKTPVGDSGTGFRALRVELARSLNLEGACICGTFSLEVHHRGGRIVEIPIELQHVDKPRSIAWYHLSQLWYVFKWLFRYSKKASRGR